MLDFAGFCRSLYHTAVVLTIEHCVKWALHVANGPKAREMDIQKFGKEREFFDLECFSERSSVHREQFLGAEARKNESFPGAATARRSCYNVTTLLVHESAFPLSPPSFIKSDEDLRNRAPAPRYRAVRLQLFLIKKISARFHVDSSRYNFQRNSSRVHSLLVFKPIFVPPPTRFLISSSVRRSREKGELAFVTRRKVSIVCYKCPIATRLVTFASHRLLISLAIMTQGK